MRLAVFGDIHANLQALEAVLADAREWMSCERYLCLGDVVGYGANPRECIEKVRALGCLLVRGNHDEITAIDVSLEGFSPLAEEALVWTRKMVDAEQRAWLGSLPYRLEEAGIEAVHASLHEPRRWPYLYNQDEVQMSSQHQTRPVCFLGHTHVLKFWRVPTPDGVLEPLTRLRKPSIDALPLELLHLQTNYLYTLNAGSVGQPRDGDVRAGYLVFDDVQQTVVPRRVEYDVELAQARILEAGLPRRLADRLTLGK